VTRKSLLRDRWWLQGFGLSYSKFTYAVISSSPPVVSAEPVRDMLAAMQQAGRTLPAPEVPTEAPVVNVTNVGKVAADEVGHPPITRSLTLFASCRSDRLLVIAGGIGFS
jgi:hypothetical protein